VSFATPPLPAINPTTPTGLPGAPVNMTGAAATQSSSQNTTTGHAAMALASASTAASRSGAVRCSATAVEDTPWWSLDFGINAKLVRGVRLALPSTCIGLSQDTTQPIWNTTALNCSTGSNVILDVYVTDAPIATNSTVAKGAPKVAVPPPGAVCALQVKVSPGRVVDIDCGRFIEGSVVTVVAREQRPVSLSLCGVTPIGGEVLSVVDAMADVQQTTVPAAMMSSFVLPLDGNGETCLDVGTSGGAANATQVSQWRLQLAVSALKPADGPY